MTLRIRARNSSRDTEAENMRSLYVCQLVKTGRRVLSFSRRAGKPINIVVLAFAWNRWTHAVGISRTLRLFDPLFHDTTYPSNADRKTGSPSTTKTLRSARWFERNCQGTGRETASSLPLLVIQVSWSSPQSFLSATPMSFHLLDRITCHLPKRGTPHVRFAPQVTILAIDLWKKVVFLSSMHEYRIKIRSSCCRFIVPWLRPGESTIEFEVDLPFHFIRRSSVSLVDFLFL